MEGHERLNRAQAQAVEHDQGPLLVVAGAGTGKTAVISLRIAQLILQKKARAEQILALTFTDKAATEMQERVDRLLPYGYVESEISTFHALGDKILREFSLELGIASDFTIMSSFQQAIFMQELLESMGLRLRYYRPLGNPYRFVSALLSFISHLKDEGIMAEDFEQFVKGCSADKTRESKEVARLRELSRIYRAYQTQAYTKGFLDYGDQILLPLKLFRTKPAVLQTYQEKYRYVLVDEFQDTNYVQFELIKLLSRSHQNIMVVGDDDQSIYRFRGAAISNILSFLDEFPAAQKIVLQKNYRSSQKILDTAYKLIQHNNPYRLEKKYRIDKKLQASKQGKKPIYKLCDTQPVEMDYVAQSIKHLTAQGYHYRDIAVLLRKNNQAKAIGMALQRRDIPYVVTESTKLLEQPEIRALLQFVNSLNDPGDSQALYGLLTSDIYQLPFASLVELVAVARQQHISLEEYLRQDLAGQSDVVTTVLQTLQSYRETAQELSGGELLYDFLQHSDYLRQLIAQANTDNHAAQKIQNISQFFELIRDFERVTLDPNIFSLWQHLARIQAGSEDVILQSSPLDLDAVRILTVHKAKGLEFRAVFVIDMVEQTFPATQRAEAVRTPEGLLTPEDQEVPWHVMDERRLFYVAMTRAKDFLCITMSYDHGGKRLKKPSRFITEAFGELPQSKPTSVSGLDSLQTFARLPQADFDPVARLYDSNGWLHISTNQVADYLRSPKEFWYFHVLGLPKGPFHALVYGSAMHAAIEHYYTAKLHNQKVLQSDMVKTFETSWKSEGFVSLQHEKDRFEQGRIALNHFYKTQEKARDYPRYIEKPFILRVDELKLVISGRYDAVFDRAGKIEIRDFKTSQIDDKKTAQKRLHESVQMAIYALAWGKSNEQVVNTISLHFVETNMLAQSAPPSTEKTMKLLEKVSSGIRNHEFSQVGQSQINFERLV